MAALGQSRNSEFMQSRPCRFVAEPHPRLRQKCVVTNGQLAQFLLGESMKISPAKRRNAAARIVNDVSSKRRTFEHLKRLQGEHTVMGRKTLLRACLPMSPWGDRIYARYVFERRLGRAPEFPPIRFNDHLFAWKTSDTCYDMSLLLSFVTDKEYAKLYITGMLGKEYVTQTYQVLRNKDELQDFAPDRFPCVLKPTNSSGPIIVCPDASTSLDRAKLAKWFDIDYYRLKREPNYRQLQPKIIIEEFFSKDGRTVPDDYKVFCVRGVPKLVQVDSGRLSRHTRNLYDVSWNRISASYVYPNREQDDPKPILLDKMLNAAGVLSAAFPFVRVDFYATETDVRVGELTFFPESASGKLKPEDAEYHLGAYFNDGAVS